MPNMSQTSRSSQPAPGYTLCTVGHGSGGGLTRTFSRRRSRIDTDSRW